VSGALETEIKLRVRSADDARGALGRIGARRVRPRHFEDNVLYDDAQRSLRAAGSLLRVRRTDDGAVLTFKGPRQERADGLKSRPEVETEAADADALEAILGGLGLRKVFRYQKYREVYSWEDVEIVVDETPIGAFLEIEGAVDSIHRAAAALGRRPNEYLAESDAALFFAAGRTGDMVFE
jgi:adenylate cyclase class 2